MIVVDTSVWIDFFAGRETVGTEKLRRLIGRGVIVIGDVILVEILQGLSSNAQAARVEQALTAYRVEAMLAPSSASVVAANYRALRAKGITIRKTIDMIIGSFCIERGYALLHNDRDFDPMHQYLGLGRA